MQLVPASLLQQKIVIVDDNEASLYATARILRAAGFTVITVSTGGAALDAADDAQVGLFILDVNLPDIDGFEVCRQLRLRGETSFLPIMHLSATFANEVDMMQGLAAGADCYLVHPVEPAVLVATVRALLFARHADMVRHAADARFRMVFELASSGIVLMDSKMTVTDVNPSLCALSGRARADIVGESARGLLFPFERCTEISQALRDSSRWAGTLALARAAGGAALVEWQIVREPASDLLIAVATDITQRAGVEAERERLLVSERAARTEAERSSRLKDEFLATLSHELRNPLNAILGWAQVLRRSVDQRALQQGVEAIDRNAKVQAHLIEDLLDFAGIRFGKMRLDFRVTDPATVIRSAVDVVKGQVQDKAIKLDVELEEDHARVVADGARLQQVIWNLLSNAIKFTSQGGSVSVRGRPAGDAYEIDISDSGCGIGPEFLPHIFERFSQEDVGTRKSYRGLGIGLALAKHLVEAHDGSIEAHSPGTGQGATFIVRLPLTERELDAAVPESTPSIAGLRLLVVDDDADARALIARMLTDAGAHVVQAASAEEALALLEQAVPGILISDIGMSRQDGYQLLRQLRQRFTARQLPAIAVTAFSRAQDRHDALEAGFQAHLSKPVRIEELVAAVARANSRVAV